MAVVRSRTLQHAREPALVRRSSFWRAQPDAVRTGVRQSDRNLENVTPDSDPATCSRSCRPFSSRIRVPSTTRRRSSCGGISTSTDRDDRDHGHDVGCTSRRTFGSRARDRNPPSDRRAHGNEEHRRPHPQREPSGRILGAARCGRAQDRWTPFALQNRPVSGVATFTDQRLDHQTAMVEWGDGSTTQTFTEFTDAFDGATGRLVQAPLQRLAHTTLVASPTTMVEAARRRQLCPSSHPLTP